MAFNDDPEISAALYGSPSCTLVPPGWPGQGGSCVGRPNLAIAHELVHQSRTAKQRVRVLVFASAPAVYFRLSRHVVKVLDKIGYHAKLWVGRPGHVDPHGQRYTWLTGWWPDFPAESQFYQPVLSCAEGYLATDFEIGCNHALDRLARRALQVQTTDTASAQRFWQRLYTAMDKDARLVATCTAPAGGVLLRQGVGNVVFNAFTGPLIDQLWVR